MIKLKLLLKSSSQHISISRYGRSFHPQVLLHQLITNLIIYQMTNQKAMDNNLGRIAEEYAVDYTCPYTPPNITPGGGGVGGGGGNGGGGGAASVGGRKSQFLHVFLLL